MMIETTTYLPGGGDIYNKHDRPVIVFSSKLIWNDYLSVSYGKSKTINVILTQNWFKDSILDNIGVSDDD